jgi:hypothetical protein
MQVIYFDEGNALSGPEFARVWAGLRCFGEEKVVGAFWQETGYPKEARFDLGSLEYVEPLLNGDDSIYGGGTARRRNLARGTIQDCDFYFTHNDPSRWDGIDVRPEFNLAISEQWLERIGVETALEKFKEHFEVADAHCPPYGLIDLASPEDAWAGMVYGSLWLQASPLHRWVEQGNWVYAASQKGDRARSIYWGNYFGPKILTRLGGREHFVKLFRERSRFADGSPSAHVWEFTNGVFVSLCLNPMGCKPGAPLDHMAQHNLEWLQKELGGKGVLCGWDSNCQDEINAKSTSKMMAQAADRIGPNSAMQSFSDLNEAEIQLIADNLDQARSLAHKYHPITESNLLDPVTLDKVYAGWQAEWQAGNALENPNSVVNAIGTAFGQCLVDCLGMQWTVVSDAQGSDLGVFFGPPATRVLVFPTHVIANRLESKETGFIQELFETICVQVSK